MNTTPRDPTKQRRSGRPALNPYYLDDVALTWSDIVQARSDRLPAAPLV